MTLEKKMSRALKKNNEIEIEKVFEEIYYEYSKLVGYIISKYVSKKSDIEELVNDVFLNFSKSLKKIKMDNIKYYLVVQSKNTAINFVNKKENKLIIEYDEEIILKQESNDNRIFYDLIRELEKYLNEYEINIIVLHSVYDMSFSEIGKKYNKPKTTISSEYYSAIRKYQKGAKNNVK